MPVLPAAIEQAAAEQLELVDIQFSDPARANGTPMPAEERTLQTQLGEQGAQQVPGLIRSQDTLSLGGERERLSVKANGPIAYGTGEAAVYQALGIFQSMKGASIHGGHTGELLDALVELNEMVLKSGIGGWALQRLERANRFDAAFFDALLAAKGLSTIGVAVHPGMRVDSVNHEHYFGGKQRYRDLDAGQADLCRRHRPDFESPTFNATSGQYSFKLETVDVGNNLRNFTIERDGQTVLRLRNVGFPEVTMMAASQYHLSVPAGELLGTMRVADLMAYVCPGLSASGTLLEGRSLGVKEARTAFLYDISTHPERFGFLARDLDGNLVKNGQWIREIFDVCYLAQAHPLIPKSHGGKHQGQQMSPELEAATENMMTYWPWNRPIAEVRGNGSVVYPRYEGRAFSPMPAIIDDEANRNFMVGLVLGLTKQFRDSGIPIDGTPEDLEAVMPFAISPVNMTQASIDGLAATVTHYDNATWTLNELLVQELLPIAQQGLEQQGVAPVLIQRYLDNVEKRAGYNKHEMNGITPADVQRFILKDLEKLGLDLTARFESDGFDQKGMLGCLVAQMLVDMAQWEKEATFKDRGLVAWFDQRYHGEIRPQLREFLVL